jgi:predicted permease
MMTPLENEQRSQGGKSRAENQSPETRSFQALLAASSRPLKNDVNMTPEQTLKIFRELETKHPWLYLFIVGADRNKIANTESDSSVLRALKHIEKAGGVIGFLGLIMLGTRLQVYSKPLKRGTKVLEDLDRVGRDVTARALVNLTKAKLPPIE